MFTFFLCVFVFSFTIFSRYADGRTAFNSPFPLGKGGLPHGVVGAKAPSQHTRGGMGCSMVYGLHNTHRNTVTPYCATYGRNYIRTLRVRSDGQCPSLQRVGWPL